MDKNLKDILETVNFIKERMLTKEEGATKDDLGKLRERVEKLPTKEDVQKIVRHEIGELVPGIVALEIKPLREDLKQIVDRLDTLDQHYANLKGVTKEIDDLRSQVRAIQKHLGLHKEIAA